jgi:hypothetical protein
MRLILSAGLVRVILSKRNLLTLLTKLDRPGSWRTIFKAKAGLEIAALAVSAETDAEHYLDRVPGVMHPVTEGDIIRESEAGVAPPTADAA